jgi:hypothetical protein
VGLGIVASAYLLGWSGAAGALLGPTAAWMEDQGWVQLPGPVGEAIRGAARDAG